MNILRLGLPKGSLQDITISLFRQAGFEIRLRERSYFPDVDDDELECVLMKPQEVGRYVEMGELDAGITGKDWILETQVEVVEVAEFIYARSGFKSTRWVLAVPENSSIKSIKDLQGKRIATEVVNITKKYLAKYDVSAVVEFSWGATEVKPPRLADAIVELTETGRSLKENRLRIIDTVLESSTKFIANKKSWINLWKKEKIENVVMLLQSAILANKKVGLMMNVHKNDLDNILSILPAMLKPTISSLVDKDWIDVITIIDKKDIKHLIPKLKRAGAIGIVEFPLNKVIQ
jgi:ATP phosphoribosyltransferase